MTEPEAADPAPVDGAVTNRKAIYSLVCGVAAFACIYLTPFLGLLVAIPAITSAIHARREITASKGQETGDSLAVIGLMIGGGAAVTVVLASLLPIVAGS